MPELTLYVDPTADSNLTDLASLVEHLVAELAGDPRELHVVVNTSGIGLGLSMSLSNRGIGHHRNNPAELHQDEVEPEQPPTTESPKTSDLIRVAADALSMHAVYVGIGTRVYPASSIHTINGGQGVCIDTEADLDDPIDTIYVDIPNISSHTRSGGPIGTWKARHVPDPHRPLYRVEGDPNAVAVGRFKASLRAFLGIERR